MSEKKISKFLYLTGAGASAKGLPVAAELTGELHQLANELDTIFSTSNPQMINKIRKDLWWLQKKGNENQTIDQFAKDCYINDSDVSLKRLKETLIVYFITRQILNDAKDIRYRNFIQKVIDEKKEFPNYIKLLTWNYDYQFQIAAKNYKKEIFQNDPGVQQYAKPLICYWPSVNRFCTDDRFDEDLSLMHLNGIAGLYDNLSMKDSIFLKNMAPRKLLEEFYGKRSEFVRHFHFAWEKNLKVKSNIINYLVEDVEYLVIIGYSFPDFNFKFDEYIFEQLKPKLKKIYFQESDSNVKESKIRGLFEIPSSIKIEMIYDCNEFYLPRELKRQLK